MATRPEDFKERLEYGNKVEKLTEEIFKQMGMFIIPKYLYVAKGAPSLFGKIDKYAVPDLDVSRNGNRFWIETKRKKIRDYYPDTGFSNRLLQHYKSVQEITGCKVFCLFWDEKLNLIYGNWLLELLKPRDVLWHNKKITYPHIENGDTTKETIVYFPYPEAFITISSIDSALNISGMGHEVLNMLFSEDCA